MKKNLRISPKELELIKGALRRTFSRSELRRNTLLRATIEHKDSARPRVTKWGKCESCGTIEARYQLDVDHIDPVVPLNKTTQDMSVEELVFRMWCEPSNLQ